MKRCSHCKIDKPLNEFGLINGKTYQYDCNPCRRKKAKIWRDANKDRLKAQRLARKESGKELETYIKHKYNIGIDYYNIMMELQGNACKICREEFTATPHIDHDHRCCPGEKSCGLCVRGLLCAHCNRALGAVKENLETLREMIKFLEKRKALPWLE